jgi:hypothetical protein
VLGKRSLEALAPLLESDQANVSGEIYMYCPYHGDSDRSASLNIETGLWDCKGCGSSGHARDIIKDRDAWVIEPNRTRGGGVVNGGAAQKRKFDLSEAEVEGWHSALMGNRDALEQFRTRRGLSIRTIKRHQIGWDAGYRAYTIPVRDV